MGPIAERPDDLQALLDSAPDAMVIVDAAGRVLVANRHLDALFGYARDELVDQPVEVLVPERFRDRHVGHRTAYEAAPAVRPMGADLELRGRRRDGTEFPVEISLSPLERDGAPLVVAAIRDATARKEAEARLQAALEGEREAAERLRELDQLKDEFLSIVSHELRTPLTAIGGFAEMLLESDVEPDLRRSLLQRVAANAEDMARMIDQLLDYSRLQAGKVRVAPATVAVADHLTALVTSLGALLGGHRVEIDADPRLRVVADPDAVSRVVSNLLTNAAKFSPEGELITVTVREVGPSIEIAVTDRGPGIPEENVEKVFERFFQARTAARSRRGTGIGLSIARRYAELLGGSLRVASVLGEGSTFTLTLPARRPRR